MKQRVVDRVEARLGLRLVAEHLNDLLTVHHFLDEALRLTERALLANEELGGVSADLLDHEQHERDSAEHDERHPDAVVEHDGQQREHHDAGDQ
ncbi:hypothetical protein SDC9_92128 [bioreactor metagenome]|uniref:Uncharacterized protein n=1 Tax=bioreactor metagenome TaxID=1076179 RepID=A0A644ZZP3_9ZZZZ